MEKAGEGGREAGIEIALDLMRYARDKFHGIYLIPPFNKHEIAVRLIEKLNE